MSDDDGIFPDPGDELSRPEARALLLAALDKPIYCGQVYHLIGPGGIGKTHELRWLHDQALERRRSGASDLLETGIIDLAHTRYQQPLLLMDTLAGRIVHSLGGRSKEAFASFFEEARSYLNLVEAGRQQAESLDAVRDQFLEGYRLATAGQRLLITIDTLERLDPGLPEVAPYDVLHLERLEVWLARLLAALPNSLTVIAGRPRPRQARELQRHLGDRFARRIVLSPLGPEEIKAIVEQYDPPETFRDLPWYDSMLQLSGGLPVRVIVALEIARVCNFDPESLPPSLRDPDTATTDRLGQDFVDTFVKSLYERDPALARLLAQACYLRKGLDPELLRALDGEPEAAVRARLGQLRRFGFVKVSGERLLTLHDDVYDMLEGRLGVTDADRWRAGAIAFFQQRQADVLKDIEQQGMDLRRLGRLRTAQIDRLYYQLARQPLLGGYQNYCELTYGAIFTRDREFDMQLQDELARFFDPQSKSGQIFRDRLKLEDYAWERIVYDEAARWVFRCIHSTEQLGGGPARALELASRIEQDFQPLLADDPLAHAALETARLEVEGLAAEEGQFAAVEARYARLARSLEQIEADATAATPQRPIHEYRRQQSRFLRAYALNNWGYLARRRLQLNTAIARYGQAIALYATLGDETNILQGTALNNLSFAYRLQGDQETGLLFVEEAIRLLHGAGARYREAAAWNTQTQLLLDLDDLFGAERSIARARALLSDFPGTRNAALQELIEANFQRWRAYRSRDDAAESEAAFDQALDAYGKFLAYFDRSPGEPERSIEGRQGLGCTYRSRARVRRMRDQAAANADLEEARRWFWGALCRLHDAPWERLVAPGEEDRSWFQEALARMEAGDREYLADLCEDLAHAYVLQKRYFEALRVLDLADQAIPPAFAVRPGAGAVETAATREHKRFWLIRSKVNLQRGICHLGTGEPEAACEQFLRAFACLLRFAPESPQLRAYRLVARQYLQQYYLRRQADAPALPDLRQRAYLMAQRLGVREAFFKLEQVFDTVEQMLTLL